MTKKQIKGIVIIFQMFLIGSLFLPVGTIIGSNTSEKISLSVFQLIDRYAGMGFSDDALIYMISACVFPAAVIFFIIFIKDRINYGVSIVLSALYASASACFYSSASRKMVDYATMNLFPYIIIFVSLVAMMMLIFAFLGIYYSDNKQSGNKAKRAKK